MTTQPDAPDSQPDPQAEATRGSVQAAQAAALDSRLEGDLSGLQRRDLIFEYITGFRTDTAEKLILGEIPATENAPGSAEFDPQKVTRATGTPAESPVEVTAERIADRLAEVFGLKKAQAAAMMGVSESTVSRHTRPSTDVLDRTLLASQIFADVSDVLGSQNAQRWFSAPNAALDSRTPLQLLSSRLGEKKVQQVIGALLDGAYL